MAWLNTAPKVEIKGKVDLEQKTRLETLKDDGGAPYYPDVECAFHVINYLFEVGPVMSNGMGTTSISSTELSSWQQNIGIRLRPWECRFISRLSKEYLSMTHEAEKIDCPSPCDASTVDRSYVSNKVKSIFKERIKQ